MQLTTNYRPIRTFADEIYYPTSTIFPYALPHNNQQHKAIYHRGMFPAQSHKSNNIGFGRPSTFGDGGYNGGACNLPDKPKVPNHTLDFWA